MLTTITAATLSVSMFSYYHSHKNGGAMRGCSIGNRSTFMLSSLLRGICRLGTLIYPLHCSCAQNSQMFVVASSLRSFFLIQIDLSHDLLDYCGHSDLTSVVI